MTSNMKLLLAVSSAKSFVSAEEKKEMGGWWSCHHFDAQVHLSSPLKPVEIEAACHLPLRKSNQRRLPIKPISTDEMEADSLLFCFALTATRRPPLSLHRGVFVCHSTFSRWVRCDLSSVSVIHSTPTPPSLPLDSFHHLSEWESGVTVMLMGLRRLSRWIATLGDSPAHMHTQWMCDTQTHRQNHTCVHSPIFATHNRTHAWLYNRGFCRTHARSSELLGLSAEGRSIWHSVPAGNRPREASCFRCIHADLKRTHAPELFPTFHTYLFKHVSVITWSLFLPSTIKVVRFSHVNTSWACFKCLTCVQIWKCLWC